MTATLMYIVCVLDTAWWEMDICCSLAGRLLSVRYCGSSMVLARGNRRGRV